jgi:hypothetical protein
MSNHEGPGELRELISRYAEKKIDLNEFMDGLRRQQEGHYGLDRSKEPSGRYYADRVGAAIRRIDNS